MMSNTATRLISLIMLLQRQQKQKAADLAGELGVSVRTLHRYFNMLDEMGIPVYSERGPYGGFSLVKGYRMPPLVFSPEESVAVYLGVSLVDEMWGELYREAARAALAKLDNVLPDEQRHEVAWARRTLLATGMHRGDLSVLAPNLEKLRRAAREHRQVRIFYQSINRPQPIQRDLDPYALVHRWGWWYVIGYCHLRQGVRTFRIDRVQELALLEETFDPSPAFNLQDYLEKEPQAQPEVQATLKFAPDAAWIAAQGQTYWETVDEQPDGSMIVEFSAPTVAWAASTALAYGPAVTVLEPKALRRMVAEWSTDVAKQYAADFDLASRSEGIE
jgi:predicted DNA-binding transcriptional regulator YafY